MAYVAWSGAAEQIKKKFMQMHLDGFKTVKGNICVSSLSKFEQVPAVCVSATRISPDCIERIMGSTKRQANGGESVSSAASAAPKRPAGMTTLYMLFVNATL